MSSDVVLLVDDDVAARERTRDLLTRSGLLVLEVRDGWEALTCLHRPRLGIRLVIVDLDLPILDGWGLIHRMRDDANLRALPTIMTSNRPVLRTSHDPPLVRKPLDEAELLRLVNQLLAASSVEHMMRDTAELPGRQHLRRDARTPVTRA